MLEACAEVEVLSTTIPLVAPAAFPGSVKALVMAAGGQVGFPVTSMDTIQPRLLL